MNRSLGLSQLLGFAVTVLGGTLLHFLYDLLGEAAWIAPFAAVNESTFEHMKLLLWPMLLYAAVQSLLFPCRTDLWCVKLRGILLGLALIPVLFYTYNGAVGPSPAWLNIAIFFLSAAIAYLSETRQLRRGETCCRHPQLSFFLLLAVALAFVLLTFRAPRLGLFRDPISGAYGI